MKRNLFNLQFFRYGVVGVASNFVLYSLYLMVTYLSVDPKLAFSVLYLVGVLQSFIFNKKWAFNHHGDQTVAFLRYFLIYGFGYFINLGALIIFVDRLGYSHHWVQGAMIPVIAVLLFVMQKIWVFRVQE